MTYTWRGAEYYRVIVNYRGATWYTLFFCIQAFKTFRIYFENRSCVYVLLLFYSHVKKKRRERERKMATNRGKESCHSCPSKTTFTFHCIALELDSVFYIRFEHDIERNFATYVAHFSPFARSHLCQPIIRYLHAWYRT